VAIRVRSRWLRGVVLTTLVGGVLALEATAVAPTFGSALARLREADLLWVAVAVAAAATSMSFFARTRRTLLGAAGVPVCQRDALAAVYVANALHVTLPGGAAFSTAWTYRWMRARGASASAITWTLVTGGVLSTSALAVLGVAGSLLAGHGTGTTGLLTDGIAVLVLTGTATLTRRRPRFPVAMALRASRAVDRVAHRPAGWSENAVHQLLAQVSAVRPRRVDWALAGACALGNWALDAGCLWAGAAALGVQLSMPVLLLTYTAGMATAGLSVLPAGIGLVDGAMVLVLTASGLPAATALPVVLLYRLVSLVGVVTVGWVIAAARAIATHPDVRSARVVSGLASTHRVGRPVRPPGATTPAQRSVLLPSLL
jgi:putative heme transporter